MGEVLQITLVAFLWTLSNKCMSILCWGLQSCTQHSRWALHSQSSVEGRTTSLNLLVMFLLMQPRIHLIFWAVSTCEDATSHPVFIYQHSQVLLKESQNILSWKQPTRIIKAPLQNSSFLLPLTSSSYLGF